MKVGVILSGCGFQDGSEIHESVLTLLALDRAGVEVACFAPDIPQARVVNHRTGEDMTETRNVLVESARIARGDIRDVREADASELDALILPGGFGAASSLSDFAQRGADCEVQADVASLIREVHAQGKPIGAICIAPTVVARVLGTPGEGGPTLTIGSDAGTAAAIEACGAHHATCPVDDRIVDEDAKIVTTPAYMLGPGVADVAKGIERCVAEVVRMAGAPVAG